MSSMVVAAVDLREEMDDSVGARALSPTRSDVAKAKLMIRTLPKECNPTPLVGSAPHAPAANAASSPKARRPSGQSADPPAAMASGDVVLEVAENPFDDITEEKLQKLTGKSDLSRVTSLQIFVDSSKQSLEVIGELLPSLQQLRIQPESTLENFRVLGTSLHSLQVLWVAQCAIADLDGVSALTELQELHAQHNLVSDISPLTMHDELRIVDLESNQIADVGQVEQLAFCPQLTSLTLRGNPLCRLQHYRRIVANFLPQLEVLDGKTVTPDERAKLTDEVVDAAIQALQNELAAEAAAELRPRSARPESSHGRRHDDPATGLSRTSSSARLDTGLSSSASDPARDDYGSTLTHGTDIVFAGNVTSALRRHRSETEGGDTLAGAASAATAAGRYPVLERPQTPARESITATLDRANELEKHKSRDAILHELKAWRLEAAGSANVGVVSMDDPTQIISPATSPTKRPPSSSGAPMRVATAERRPNSSAGVVRNVREAFVEPAAKPGVPLVKRHSSSNPIVPAITVPTSSARNVDILVLDEDPQHDDDDDDQQPCSPRKTSRGVFTTSTRAGGDWNLEEIAPKLDLESTASFLQRTSRRKQESDEDDAESASSGSDSEDMRTMARQLKQRKPASKPPTHMQPASKGFFNVAESLHAIDRWREQLDDDATAAASEPRAAHVARRKTSGGSSAATADVRTSNATEGLACSTPDGTIVQWMKDKHANVAEIKTRDGFRRFFRGIDEPRLTRILQRVFGDGEKVRRRLQLMQGFYGGQNSSSS